ncbi:MAG: hypothetical protein J6S71_09110 [Clostridia bacterium]|nr:hypothetical protein [Clostridia bacterium]
MENLLNAEFKRKFSLSMYKNLKLKLGEMSFYKDFVTDTRGDLYPILLKSDDCVEYVEANRYGVRAGSVTRLIGQFFPYATYEMTATVKNGAVGFRFILPSAEAEIAVSNGKLRYLCGERKEELDLPESVGTMIVSCRPGAFDVYFKKNGKSEFFTTFAEESFRNSNDYAEFSDGKAALSVSGEAEVSEVSFYIDNGTSIADMRPIRYENGEVMIENGKIYITASIRMQTGTFQGIFSWIPGTAEFELTGALFYDCGDGKWCGDVAASLLWHRDEKLWYLWVCAFSHGHILAHSTFEGDVRFGVNVIDVELMAKADADTPIDAFLTFAGDEDPDFFYDAENSRWLMAICRRDPVIKNYRYFFFESDSPFEGYKCIGKGRDGAETGGSFVKVNGEQYFLCGNDFRATSDYRIYGKHGMSAPNFDYPDGGFRGWGTLMPIKLGSRTRYFWLTFDRHRGSDYNWSYGNLYCFEAK